MSEIMVREKESLNTVVVTGPSLVETKSGIKIYIDKDNNVTIYGQRSIKLDIDGDFDLQADNINMRAKSLNMDVDGDIYIGSSTHMIQQAPRIDLNPKVLSTGYRDEK
jgi:pectate lyase